MMTAGISSAHADIMGEAAIVASADAQKADVEIDSCKLPLGARMDIVKWAGDDARQ